MNFLTMYGDQLDTELGSEDRSQRFTVARRKAAVNEGQRVFNEQTGCFVKRGEIALTDALRGYRLDNDVRLADDYMRVAKVSASLARYDGSGSLPSDTAYTEGPSLPYRSEEWLNQSRPGWRSENPGMPTAWTLRSDGAYEWVEFDRPPDIPSAETWVLVLPYVAIPADMVDDEDEPYTTTQETPNIGKSTLRPYHKALVHYAAAQLEKLRKNYEAVDRQTTLFSAYVAKYMVDLAPARGSQLRLAENYRTRLRSPRVVDPFRY